MILWCLDVYHISGFLRQPASSTQASYVEFLFFFATYNLIRWPVHVCSIYSVCGVASYYYISIASYVASYCMGLAKVL